MLRRSIEPGQYLALRYTQRLANAGAVASVGSTGDSYDNALAEALNSLFKAELIRNKGPWRSIDDLEIAVAEYIDWFNYRRLHGEIGTIPAVEYEHDHYRPPPRTDDRRRVSSEPPLNPARDSRELARNSGRDGRYQPGAAQRLAVSRRRRPRPRRLEIDSVLRDGVQ